MARKKKKPWKRTPRLTRPDAALHPKEAALLAEEVPTALLPQRARSLIILGSRGRRLGRNGGE